MTTIIEAELLDTITTSITLADSSNHVTPNNASAYLNQIIQNALEEYRCSHRLTTASTDTELLEEFLTIRAKNSPNTHRAYNTHCSEFLVWLQGGLLSLTVKMLGDYAAYLRERDLKQNSIAGKIKAIKSLLSYASDTGYLPNNPGRIYGSPAFTEAVEERELKNTSNKDESEINKFFGVIKNSQHKLIFGTLSKTGLRAQELINLKWSQELINTPGTFKILGKGNKERLIYIPNDLYTELMLLKDDSDFIFHSAKGTKFSYSYLLKICKQYVRKSGINAKCSLHWFRHWYANQLRLKFVDIYEISALLGHASINTTQKYFHADKANKFNDLIVI